MRERTIRTTAVVRGRAAVLPHGVGPLPHVRGQQRLAPARRRRVVPARPRRAARRSRRRRQRRPDRRARTGPDDRPDRPAPDEPGYTPLSERLVRLGGRGRGRPDPRCRQGIRLLDPRADARGFPRHRPHRASAARVPARQDLAEHAAAARRPGAGRLVRRAARLQPPEGRGGRPGCRGDRLRRRHRPDRRPLRHSAARPLDLDGERWGWHDAAVALRGPAAERVWAAYAQRWSEATTLPPRRYIRWSRPWAPHRELINPAHPRPAPAAPPARRRRARPSRTAVRVLRSMNTRKVSSAFPWRCRPWDSVPPTGVHEVFETLTAALRAAQRYVYLEDQYLQEDSSAATATRALSPSARRRPPEVKVIMVGSGVRDPEDPGVHLRPINRDLTGPETQDPRSLGRPARRPRSRCSVSTRDGPRQAGARRRRASRASVRPTCSAGRWAGSTAR